MQSLKFRILRRSFIGVEFALNLPPFANIDTNQKIVFYLQGKIFLAAIEIFNHWKMTKKKIWLKMYGKKLTLQKIEILIRHFCISAGYKLVCWRGVLWIHHIYLFTQKIVTKAGKNYTNLITGSRKLLALL